MGILGWRDLLSAKWLTALNTDVNGRLFFIPIKHLLGDYFVAKINGHIFAFEMGYQQIKTYVATASQFFKVVFYDTGHFRPIHAAIQRKLKLWLEAHWPPSSSLSFMSCFRVLGERELAVRQPPPHDPTSMTDVYATYKDSDIREIDSYVRGMATDEIVKPTETLRDYLDTELRTTHPAFLGQLAHHIEHTDNYHKQMNNVPIHPAFLGQRLMILGITVLDLNITEVFEGMGENDTITIPPLSDDQLESPHEEEDCIEQYVAWLNGGEQEDPPQHAIEFGLVADPNG